MSQAMAVRESKGCRRKGGGGGLRDWGEREKERER